jgi:hypothetical protein
MNPRHPALFYPELTDDRLTLVATALLDIRYLTIREMNSPHDDNYTRETAVFGRSKNMLISLAQGGQHDWLSLRHAGMDITTIVQKSRVFTDEMQWIIFLPLTTKTLLSGGSWWKKS